jgi:16S rRNA (adenine1518-N6/adenine1519-N6)-dimethyltransferase
LKKGVATGDAFFVRRALGILEKGALTMNRPHPEEGRAVRPMKRLGQHFLHDAAVVNQIVEAAGPLAGSAVLEIGPGTGALTKPLVEGGADVVAIELDPYLADDLRAAIPDPRLTVVTGDAVLLKWSRVAAEVWGDRPLTVVGNLPYYITGPLVAHLWEETDLPWQRAVLMCQSEVGARLAAPPGQSPAGAPTVMLQAVADVARVFEVPAASFLPPPKVTSTVIVATRRAKPVIEPLSRLREVVRAGFGQRRKMLPRALSALGPSTDWWRARLAEAGIDPTVRAERLTLAEWRRVVELWAMRDGGGADHVV